MSAAESTASGPEELETFLEATEVHHAPPPRRRTAAAAALALAAAACGAAVVSRPKRTPHSGEAAAQAQAQAIVGLDAADCADKGQDCSKSKCCKIGGHKCFEKNEFWAACSETCAPGVHPGEDNKGWTCNVLSKDGGAPAKDAPPCVGNGADCQASKCCTDSEAKCFRKNSKWAMCMKACEPGVHKDDPDKKPWTCEALLPDKKPKYTGPPEVPTPPVHCDRGAFPHLAPFSGYNGPASNAMIKVLSYNLYWWNLYGVRDGNDNSAGKLIQASNGPLPWDLMGFQECEDGHRVVEGAGLIGDMEVYQFQPLTRTSAICMAYRKAAFNKVAQGGEFVAEDGPRQYFGKRALQWQRLLHRPSGKFVFFANHHGPLAVNSGGKCGGAITGMHILRVIATYSKPGDAIILTGDFNANPGSETLRVIDQQLHDFVPAGIDNIYSNLGQGALVRNADIGDGGSDHHARLATFKLTPPAYGQGVWGR